MMDGFKVEPEHWRFGGGPTETVLHPVVLVGMLITIVLMLGQPKKVALAAYLLSTFLIPAGQQFVIGGGHVFVSRIIIAVGWIGITRRTRREAWLAANWNSLDKLFLTCVICQVMAVSLLNMSGSAVVQQIGFAWDFMGSYILLRHLIQNEGDITWTIKCFAYLAVVLGICMVGEQMTGKNVFGFLRGVRLVSEVRDGQIRSEGVFQHAILAGVFGATLLPLFIWLWKSGKANLVAIVGIVSSTVMTITSRSSTPAAVYGVACLGLCFWPIRKYMRLVRWALGILLIVLHISMKAPIWALIERVDIIQGASSYHRFQLVDQFIKHWPDWWLIGTNSNANWGDFMFDVSNQYVAEGINGGLILLVLFICQISWCFGRLGSARRAIERQNRLEAWLPWLLGVAMLGHVIAFLGISYFDQMRVSWFTLLAVICVATSRGFPRPSKNVLDGERERLAGLAKVHADALTLGMNSRCNL